MKNVRFPLLSLAGFLVVGSAWAHSTTEQSAAQGSREVYRTVRCTVDDKGQRNCVEQNDARPTAGPLLVLDRFAERLLKGDLAGLAELLDDSAMIYEGGAAETKAQYLAHHAAADAQFLAGSTRSERQRQARVVNGMASINTKDLVVKGADRYDSAETAVLMETPQGWKIISLHWSSRKLK